MARQTRLSKTDWILAGLKALVTTGPEALKAEPLARALNTTKGSFYWHFKDVPAYREALLALWEARAYAGMVEELEREGSAVARLRRLGETASSPTDPDLGDSRIEPAIRAWAQGDPVAAAAVGRVDAQRLAYLQGLLNETGVSNPEMARIIYAAGIGMEDLSLRDGTVNVGAMGSLVDLVLALR